MSQTLSDEDMPAIYRSADKASLKGQRKVLSETRWALRLGVVAAMTGIISLRVGAAQLDIAAGLGVVAFVGALVLTLRISARRYEEHWYRGRAIAESVKTLAWRYAVGGDTFPVALDTTRAGNLMAERVQSIIDNAGEVPLEPQAGSQITEQMSRMRGESLENRRRAYVAGRIDDQIDWYNSKASANGTSTTRWGLVTASAYIGGICAAVGRFVGWFDIDGMGVAAAVAAAALAWVQLRQHRVLAASYALAAQELTLARDRLELVASDDVWAREVSDAEDAISREHTMWLARHGHLGR